jgi:hypothetical protein
MKARAVIVDLSIRFRRVGLVLALAGGMLLAAPANAACSAAGCYSVLVTEVYMNSLSAGFYVQTSGDETLANCTPSSGVLLSIPEATPHFKELYALFLTAATTNMQVTIVINQGTNPCTVSYARLINY